jgi:hypothetical protein
MVEVVRVQPNPFPGLPRYLAPPLAETGTFLNSFQVNKVGEEADFLALSDFRGRPGDRKISSSPIRAPVALVHKGGQSMAIR